MIKFIRVCSRIPMGSSAQIINGTGIQNVSKLTLNRVLHQIADTVKPSKQTVLSKKDRDKRLFWLKEYMMLNYETVIFTGKCHATLDGPDGRGQAWVRTGMPIPIRMWSQQGGEGVMFWAGIVNDTLVGPFTVPEGIKIS